MSIIGNPILLGGGGGLSPSDALIHVLAPVGSTITLAKGGVVVKVLDASKSHVNASDPSKADWYYSIKAADFGQWDISGSKNGGSGTGSVTITENKQYDLQLSYRLYLYNLGDMVTALTGGYSAVSEGTFTNLDTYMQFFVGRATEYAAASNNAIDFSDYNALVASARCGAGTSYPDRYRIGIGTTRGSYTKWTRIPVPTSTPQIITLDFSTVDKTVPYFVQFSNASPGNPTIVDYIYLE